MKLSIHINSKSAIHIESLMVNGIFTRKTKKWVSKTIQKCIRQCESIVYEISDDTFKYELLIERQKHFLNEIKNYKYWDKQIHKQWLESFIISLCRKYKSKVHEKDLHIS